MKVMGKEISRRRGRSGTGDEFERPAGTFPGPGVRDRRGYCRPAVPGVRAVGNGTGQGKVTFPNASPVRESRKRLTGLDFPSRSVTTSPRQHGTQPLCRGARSIEQANPARGVGARRPANRRGFHFAM